MDTTRFDLLNARRERGWTQAKLAAKLGVSVQTISRWEKGHLQPSRRHLTALRRVLRSSHESVARAMLATARDAVRFTSTQESRLRKPDGWRKGRGDLLEPNLKHAPSPRMRAAHRRAVAHLIAAESAMSAAILAAKHEDKWAALVHAYEAGTHFKSGERALKRFWSLPKHQHGGKARHDKNEQTALQRRTKKALALQKADAAISVQRYRAEKAARAHTAPTLGSRRTAPKA